MKRILAIILSLMMLASGSPAHASPEMSIEDCTETEIEQTIDETEPAADLEEFPHPENEAPPDDFTDPSDNDDTVENTILAHGHAYITTVGNADVYTTADMTDGNGKIPDIPVTPGKYTFREVLAPEGYALNMEEFAFEVDAEGNVTGDTTIRDDYTRITLKKQDEGGKPLAGVAFGLLDENGTRLFTAISDETGLVTFEKIPYGDFTIVEIEPLPGYIKSGTQVEVSVDGFFVNLAEPIATIVNQPIIDHYYAFMKTDHEDNPLSGVKFVLEDESGAVLRELVSGDDGVVHVNGLALGTYTIRETEALEGFTVSEETIRVVIDEQYAMPAEMARLKNYPNIQTGVEMVMTPVMWAGAGLVLVGAGVMVAHMTKGKRARRRKKRR